MLCNKDVRRIALKELTLFFSSPIAYLFLGSFVAVMLYLFFWVETFFARNISDIRPLFEWMPVLLIFLSSALTMRMWSEEYRSGTIEFVITLPVSPVHFVLGKFYACMILLLLALLLTVSLPISVMMIADLDWGPVLAGYLAALLLGASYLSIGLFVSARSDSQIVSLIVTVFICGLFNLAGSPFLTDLFSSQTAEWMRLLGSGSRFESIERGVIDVRDLYYYLSITIVFLLLNAYSLERQVWAKTGNHASHTGKKRLLALLLINVMLVNVWLLPLNKLRVDVTRGQFYTLSDASQGYLSRLQEPLLIRAYFSAKTHPLLAPLVPRLKDMLQEYAVAGQGRVRVEIVDPIQSPQLEDEANKKYGIKPVPLQITDKYQAALVNSYFNILVEYGDEYEVLGFRELIEAKVRGESDIDVRLRNPEYDITRSIKKVLYAYQSGGDLFGRINQNLNLTAYISSDQKLPKILQTLKSDIKNLTENMQSQAQQKLQVNFVEPDNDDGAIARMLNEVYGFKPMAASLLDEKRFYFYVVLEGVDQKIQIPLPSDYKIDEFKRSLNAAVKRFASGFLKTAGMVVPTGNPYMAQLGLGGPTFKKLQEVLETNLTVKKVDLIKGVVPGDIDLLLVLSPKDLTEKALFAIDQFLMQGGTVLLSTSPFVAELKDNTLKAKQQASGLQDWLKHHGINISDSFVMDSVNASFPVPVTRTVNGFSFQEVRMLDYPYFADVRQGLNSENTITSDLGQLTMSWASPITIDKTINSQREIIELISSSEKSWLSSSTDIMPRLNEDGSKPFPAPDDLKSSLMGVVVEGKFTSYFTGKSSPLLVPDGKDESIAIGGVINHSSEAARLILFSSNEFINDKSVGFLASGQGALYLNSYQLIANAVDWSLEDRGLLQIRSRGHFNQTLPPMEAGTQALWEYANYVWVIIGIALIYLYRRVMFSRKKRFYVAMLELGDANG